MFHTTRQFHATISHYTLFFTTPFCTTSHSVVHPGHRHSTSYNIPFHITPYNKYISSVASFKSALKTPSFSPLDSDYFACVREVECHCFRACVCSGHISHHKCCSIYVISRVQHCISHHSTPHHIKRFHATHHSITSHQKILHHTTFHVTPFHTTIAHST